MDAALTKRVITAVFGIAVILSLIVFGGRWGMTALALLASFGALFEFFIMLFESPEQKIQRFVGIGIGFILSAFIIFRSFWLYEGIVLLFLALFLVYIAFVHMGKLPLSKLFSDLSYSFMGIFYISFLFSFWPKIRELESGVLWVFLVFLIPWMSDTAGYFGGKKWGKHKLSPLISPNKTIEGSSAAMLAACVGVICYKFIFFHDLSIMSCLFLGVFGSVASQLGDLFESLIKRALDVKDSGIIIPGHGGVLDRFDSVLFCGPFIYFYALMA